jgi:hypothetical protein
MNVIDIFVSCPSDVSEYLDVIKREAEIFNISHLDDGNSINIINYPHDAPSGIGKTPQNVIDETIANNYDIYIGLMGCRFGTETKTHISGTYKECHDAIDKYKKGSLKQVSFFFYRGSVGSLDEIDSEQLSRVNSFRNELSDMGDVAVLYRDFKEEAALSMLFHTTIASALNKIRLDEGKYSATVSVRVEPENNQPTQPDTEEIGLYEHVETGVSDMEEATHAIEEMTTYINEYQAILEKETESIKQSGAEAKVPQSVIMRLIAKSADRIGDQMIILADKTEPKAKCYRDKSSSAFNHILEAIAINSSASDDGKKGKDEMRESLAAHLASMTEAKASLEEMIKATDSFKNYTTVFARGRKKLSKALHYVDQSIASCQSQASDLIQLLTD